MIWIVLGIGLIIGVFIRLSRKKVVVWWKKIDTWRTRNWIKDNWFWCYIGMAMLTFGHCFTHYPGSDPGGRPSIFMTTVQAGVAGVGWPLYITAHAATAVWGSPPVPPPCVKEGY